MPHITYQKERQTKWLTEAGRTAMQSPDGSRRIVWDLLHESGPAQIEMDHVHAGDALERDKGRYVAELPVGVRPGPHVGANRVIM
jgi:hypothetical protein